MPSVTLFPWSDTHADEAMSLDTSTFPLAVSWPEGGDMQAEIDERAVDRAALQEAHGG